MSVTNRAPTVRFPRISIVQDGSVPLQAPVQPVKYASLVGLGGQGDRGVGVDAACAGRGAADPGRLARDAARVAVDLDRESGGS